MAKTGELLQPSLILTDVHIQDGAPPNYGFEPPKISWYRIEQKAPRTATRREQLNLPDLGPEPIYLL